jgi:hypothetical protein
MAKSFTEASKSRWATHFGETMNNNEKALEQLQKEVDKRLNPEAQKQIDQRRREAMTTNI